MCGIAGIFLLQPRACVPDLPARLRAMAAAMQHRGPDDEGLYLAPGGRGGLVSRRLAIRDLSPAGHMPMSNAAQTVWLTYNGELYNTDELRPPLEQAGYTFHSPGDTEVLLHGYEAWGAAVLPRLRGMWACAALTLDAATGQPQRLFLARDRLGIKPLYYAQTAETFVFASELKALLASGLVDRALSSAGLVGYLLLGSVPNPLTIYAGARALEPGASLTLPLDRPAPAQPVRYWRLPTETVVPVDAAATVDEVRALLAEAVRIRLVSDVPLGAFLSGGIDSSAVVALMRQAHNGPIRTCAMVFAEAAYSEAPYARAVAAALGTDHYERVITAADVAQEWDAIFTALDQPSVDGVNTYFVSQTAREAGLTVALSGLGGDELFGGYPNTFGSVPGMYRALRLAHAAPGGAALARAAVGLLPDRHRWARTQDALRGPPSPARAYLTRRGLFAPAEVRRLVRPAVWQAAAAAFDLVDHVAARADVPHNGHAPFATADARFAWISRAELSTYTHHQLLRDTDAMSMAHSLEVRVPLLDHRLVEAVVRLPAALKAAGPGPKPLLLRCVGDLLPPLVRERRAKQGFIFPFADWLRGPLRPALLQGDATTDLWLRPGSLAAARGAFDAGRLHWSRLWALTVLQHWTAGH